MTTYYISQFPHGPPLEVEIEPPPPCLFCAEPVMRPSMDGPLVCASCDCGCNRDGSRWTREQSEERWARRRTQVAKYREASARKALPS